MNRRRGRPLDPARDRAILDAAREVIAECGYTGATMEGIARTAGVGKDTLYRRWPSKEQLAVELIDQLASEVVPPRPLDIDPRFNLFLFIKDIARLNSTTGFGPLVAGVVGEAARNEDLAASFRAFWAKRRSVATDLVRDVVGRDVSDQQVEYLLDRVLGPIYYRLLLTGAEITDEFLWNVVASIPWNRPEDL